MGTANKGIQITRTRRSSRSNSCSGSEESLSETSVSQLSMRLKSKDNFASNGVSTNGCGAKNTSRPSGFLPTFDATAPLSATDHSRFYNTSSRSKPAELFRKDLISAMKLADSEQLLESDYILITDHWKEEWEKGVQVPVNPDALPSASFRRVHNDDSANHHNDTSDDSEFESETESYIQRTREGDRAQERVHVLDSFFNSLDTSDDDEGNIVSNMSSINDNEIFDNGIGIPVMSNKKKKKGKTIKQKQLMPKEWIKYKGGKFSDHLVQYELDLIDLSWRELMAKTCVPPIPERLIEDTITELERQCAENVKQNKIGIEFNDGVVCDVCRSPYSEEGNEMVFCDSCDVCVHQACYDIEEIPDGQWFCQPCKELGKSEKASCILCPNKRGAMKRTPEDTWAHVSCSLWVASQIDGDHKDTDPSAADSSNGKRKPKSNKKSIKKQVKSRSRRIVNVLPYLYPNEMINHTKSARSKRKKLIKSNDYLLCISSSTANDLEPSLETSSMNDVQEKFNGEGKIENDRESSGGIFSTGIETKDAFKHLESDCNLIKYNSTSNCTADLVEHKKDVNKNRRRTKKKHSVGDNVTKSSFNLDLFFSQMSNHDKTGDARDQDKSIDKETVIKSDLNAIESKKTETTNGIIKANDTKKSFDLDLFFSGYSNEDSMSGGQNLKEEEKINKGSVSILPASQL